ncbi:MAG: peptidoglycan DD-metalloendopeptidase family protein, partial [Oscillospiraceae bacterium]|nr:peptidoglycan DD-metalloendopeptidase family protein [Oscillospiraceae bacterium]
GLEDEADSTALSVMASAVPTSAPAAPTVEPLPPVTAQPKPEKSEPETIVIPDEPAEPVMEGKPMPEEVMAEINKGSLPEVFVWPVAGTVETPHSVEALVYSRTMADWRTHTGLDIAAGLGSKVIAAAEGTVEQVFSDDMYGTTVVIHHGGGLRSIYSNLAEKPTVSVGDSVALGDVIGSVGQTALAEVGDVNHLHFEMTLDGEAVDPAEYLPLH